MLRMRMLLTWIVLLAIPLQGVAAASMLFCGMSSQERVSHVHAVGAAGDHQQRQDHARHKQHHHQGNLESAQIQGDPAETQQHAGSAHKCSVCAACSHSVGMTGFSTALAVAAAPQAEPDMVVAAMHSHSTRVDDKPPRR